MVIEETRTNGKLEIVVVLDGVTLQWRWRRILLVRDEFHWFILARRCTCIAITLRFLRFIICGWILDTAELNGTDAVLVDVEFAWQIAGIAIDPPQPPSCADSAEWLAWSSLAG